ncbi:MAG: hypothetical protein RIE87_11855 [Rhodospirillales bacterium]
MRTKVSFRLSPRALARVDDAARRHGLTHSGAAEYLLSGIMPARTRRGRAGAPGSSGTRYSPLLDAVVLLRAVHGLLAEHSPCLPPAVEDDLRLLCRTALTLVRAGATPKTGDNPFPVQPIDPGLTSVFRTPPSDDLILQILNTSRGRDDDHS